MRKRINWITAAVIGMAVSTVQAQVDALASARYDLKLGFTVDGRLAHAYAKPGDYVKANAILLELDAQEVAATRKLAKLLADSDLDVKAAEEKLTLAKIERDKLKALLTERASSEWEVRKAEAQAILSQIELDIAQRKREEAALQYEQIDGRYEQFLCRAPKSGYVEMVASEEGELVEKNRPILRLVVIDPMLVTAWVSPEQLIQLKVNGSAWIRHKLPGQTDFVEGKIISLGQVADSGSQTWQVRIEVPNPKMLPAGDHVDVYFTDPAASTEGQTHDDKGGR